MINFFVCYDTSTWESNIAFMERDRCLTEYIMPELRSRYGSLGESEIEHLKKFPCVFAYEQVHRRDAYIGNINDITVRQTNVSIDYKLTGEKILFDDFLTLSSHFDLGSWEMNRTHWTIKNVDLEKIRPLFYRLARKPTVFISYSWTPIENQRYVFDLVSKLFSDGVNVIYDKNNLHPGQDKDYFMEKALTTDEIDYVLVICNKEYAQKADDRRGGVGYESEIIISHLISQPLQRKIIPVVIETNEKGQAYLPTFLKSRRFIDLTQEQGYSELLNSLRLVNE